MLRRSENVTECGKCDKCGRSQATKSGLWKRVFKMSKGRKVIIWF